MNLVNFLLGIIILVLSSVFYFLRKRQKYWSDQNVPCVPNPDMIMGHVRGLGTSRHASYINTGIYQQLKNRGVPFGGFNFFMLPSVMVVDPELVKNVLVRDFHIFHDRGIFSNPEADPLAGHLFLLEGAPWRTMRQKLSPTFTSGRMKNMFGTILEVAEEFKQYMITNSDAGLQEVEMKDVLARFTTDVIGTCAFGLKCDTLKNPESDFLKYGKKVITQSKMGLFKFIFASSFRELAMMMKIKLTDDDVEEFFMKLTKDTVEYREKNNVKRNDFMNLLLQIKNNEPLKDQVEELSEEAKGLTMDELAAQCFVFFIAGYETSSTTMNFCLYELAMNPNIQERLRTEIETAIKANNGQVTYDLVMGLQYLDNVVNETLRKYPPVESLNRVPLKDYPIPGTNHVIPKGKLFVIPAYALHHDPDIYPDPESFNPDRFNPEVVAARHPYTFIPFGEGPRICIGLRFGVMQTKIGLITLLRNFRFSPSASTPNPIVFDPASFVLSPTGGNYLKLEKI